MSESNQIASEFKFSLLTLIFDSKFDRYYRFFKSIFTKGFEHN